MLLKSANNGYTHKIRIIATKANADIDDDDNNDDDDDSKSMDETKVLKKKSFFVEYLILFGSFGAKI